MAYLEAEHRESFTNDLLAFTLINEETVEKILDSRITVHNQRIYKVRWKDSWLLEDQLKEHCMELLKRFWRYPPTICQDPYQLPCFGKTFSSASCSNPVQPTDMLNDLVFSDEQSDVSNSNSYLPPFHQNREKLAATLPNQPHTLGQRNETLSNEFVPSNQDNGSSPMSSFQTNSNININNTAAKPVRQDCTVETDDEEFPVEAITAIFDSEEYTKVCLDCQVEFETKCRHCASCRNCRNKSRCHYADCHGDKICAICEHCIEGEVCKICCPYCGQVYPTSGHWRRHVKVTHLGLDKPKTRQERRKIKLAKEAADPSISMEEKKYECQTCNKCFMNPHKLKRHEKIHSDVKEFKCHVCQKEFVQKVHLQKHLLQHGIGEKRFKCHTCEKWFNHKVSLKTHAPKCSQV